MSSENMNTGSGPSFGMDSPIASASKPKSSKKFWIFGGLGCLGLIGLVCIGFLGMAYYFGAPAMAFINENMALIEASPKVSEALGPPVTLGPPQTSQDPSKPTVIIFSGTASGSSGSGTYVIEALMESGTPERQAIYLEVGGQKIDLDPDSLFELEVDDGA